MQMRRVAVIGVLVLVLATLAGPAFADGGDGSVLPGPGHEQPLPAPGRHVTPAQPPALADTGFEVTETAALGLGLLALGGATVLISRRRASG